MDKARGFVQAAYLIVRLTDGTQLQFPGDHWVREEGTPIGTGGYGSMLCIYSDGDFLTGKFSLGVVMGYWYANREE